MGRIPYNEEKLPLETGEHVASGVYFYRLKADGFEQSKKMVMLK